MLKDIDESKSSLQNPLLPDDIVFEGAQLGWVPVLKFEDWDFADHEKFPYLVNMKLILQKMDAKAQMIEWSHANGSKLSRKQGF